MSKNKKNWDLCIASGFVRADRRAGGNSTGSLWLYQFADDGNANGRNTSGKKTQIIYYPVSLKSKNQNYS